MAQTVVTVDDIDGTFGAKTIPFSVGKDSWEIDLTEENEQRLRDALAPFITKARKQPRTRSAQRTSSGSSNNREIRAWAQEQGIAVPARGRIPQTVVDAYADRNGK